MKTRFLFHIILAVLVVTLSSGCTNSSPNETPKNPNGRNDVWEHIGIGGGGSQFIPTISPHDPNIVLVTCDMGGCYITYNAGELWRMFNLSCRCRFFVYDPVNPDVIYANTNGLFKSVDRGNTWTLFYPKMSEITGMVSKGDHAGEVLVTKDNTSRSVQALAIDPARSDYLFAAIRIDQSTGFYTSVDGGESWNMERAIDGTIMDIFIDPSSPAGNRTIFMTTEKGILQRTNGQWQDYRSTAADVKYNTFAGGYDTTAKKYVIYAISSVSYWNREKIPPGIYYTEDGGKTWENRQEGLLKYSAPNTDAPVWNAIGTSAFHAGTVYVSYMRMVVDADTTYGGVAKSTDFGKTWTLPWIDKSTRGKNVIAPNFGRDWMTERWDRPWGGMPFQMGVAPNNPDVVFATDYGRTVKTVDGGKTWANVTSKVQPDDWWTTRGLEVTTGYDIVFDPFDENHVFQALTDIGLIESRDGGKSWLSATNKNGVPPVWVNTTYWLAFDREVKGRGWAVMSYVHDLPRPKMFRESGVANYRGGILITEDAGTTWQVVSETIGEAAMTHILYDPTSDRNARTLYACAFGKGVYKSTDGGKTWIQKNNGLEGDDPYAWKIERRQSDGALFLVISRRTEDGSIGNAGDGALYRSTDGAESWTKMTLPEGCNGPNDIFADPRYPQRLALAAWGKHNRRERFAPDTGGGIFLSENDGQTWKQVMENDQHIYAISFDPRNNRYYACGFNAAAYYSQDDMKTWNRIQGFNFKWGHRVVPDPRDAEKIFIMTFGGGVWYGPAKGDPNAVEDIVPPLKRL